MKQNVLILGASSNPMRYSYKAIEMLQEKNFTIFAIGGKEVEVKGVKIYTEAQEDWKDIDTITMYLNTAHQKMYYDEILRINPRRVIFNPGSENQELEKLLQENNIQVEKACTLVLLRTNMF
ncbi:CoA-binding protein [Aureivirga sp. CE67]|uniref:CoA-binding protein n=1 Tax=Aureivirga sp. CE67 TaxID=1788983 RepID=UPI0018CB92FD|nr:CoA-binding protein [Aureivirga sp. CE67]